MCLPPGITIPQYGNTEVVDDLLVQQLHEWAKIEDDYDQIPWIISDPGEEEYLFDKLDEAVQRHITHARAGPETGQYLTRQSINKRGQPLRHNHGWVWQWWDQKENIIAWPWIWRKEERKISDEDARLIGLKRWTQLTSCGSWIQDEEDDEGRIVIDGVMTHKGMNYMKASTAYGDCYINLKFTSYVPEIGGPIKMLCRFQDPTKNIPMKCIKVLTDVDKYGDARAPL